MQHAVDEQLDGAQIREQLALILQSRVFRTALRSQRFLTYLVENALAQPPVAAKEYTVAMEVFDRDPTYDPAIDATVRVEASRLRSRLREYFGEEGRDAPWLIDFPKGGYAVTLRRRLPANPRLQEVLTLSGAAALNPQPNTAPGSVETSDDAGRRRALRPALWAACVLLLLAGTGLAIYRLANRPSPATRPAQRSLAILPIANQTSNPAMTYIADGLTDDLIRELSRVPALKLMARTTVFHYRGQTGDPQAVARSLGVDAVMTSELHRTPEHTTLSVELTDAHDGSAILDREYIADHDDLRTVQAEVQHDVLTGLHAEDSARDPGLQLRSVTSSPQAYQEFLTADALARNADPAALRQAIVHAEKASALDPKFDLAWSTLASAHLYLGVFFEPPRNEVPIARQLAQRALSLNPKLGEAHGTLGLIDLLYDWNLPAADAELNSADAQAAAVSTLACTAHLMQSAGQLHTAQELLTRLLSFDPRSSALIAEMGCVNFYGGQYETALRYYRQALEADPQSPVPYWGVGKSLNAEARYPEAVAALAKFRERNGFEPPLLTAEAGYAWGASGHRDQALAVIRNLQETGAHTWIDPYFVSVVYLSMNDRDNAFLWLNRAVDSRSSFTISILTEPKWQPMHADPRFAAVVSRMRSESKQS